jgi:hypothetical protein
MAHHPLVAITMGDAAGIGAEIIMKSLGHAEIYARCRPLVIGDAKRLRAAGSIIGSSLSVRVVRHAEIETAVFESGVVNCIDLGLIPADLPWGRLSSTAGAAAFRYVETAMVLLLSPKGDLAFGGSIAFALGTGAAVICAALIKFAVLPGLDTFPAFCAVLEDIARGNSAFAVARLRQLDRRGVWGPHRGPGRRRVVLRLAQRIPVRVHIHDVPPGVTLAAGCAFSESVCRCT